MNQFGRNHFGPERRPALYRQRHVAVTPPPSLPVPEPRAVVRGKSFALANRAVLAQAPVETITDYDGFRRALNQRRVALGMTMETLDQRTGLADGYCSKILATTPSNHGRFYRNIGPTALDCLLPALRVRLRLEPID